MIMLLHLTRVDDVMCFKHISFLFLVQKKRLEVNVGEKWNLLSFIVNIRKSRQYCPDENINVSLSIKWDKREHRQPKLTSREKANAEFMNVSRVVWLGVKLWEEPLKIWTRYKE